MAYKRKTIDVWRLYQNFGYGWEEILEEDTFDEIIIRKREYKENQPQFPIMIKRCRIPA